MLDLVIVYIIFSLDGNRSHANNLQMYSIVFCREKTHLNQNTMVAEVSID